MIISNICDWLCRQERWFDKVNIVLVGKYTSLQDSYMSVIKALEHAAMRCQRKLVLEVSSISQNRLVKQADTMSVSIVGGSLSPRA